MRNKFYRYIALVASLLAISCNSSDSNASGNDYPSSSSTSVSGNHNTVSLCPNESVSIMYDDGSAIGVVAPCSGNDTTFIYDKDTIDVVINSECRLPSCPTGLHYSITACSGETRTVATSTGAIDLQVPTLSLDTTLYYNIDTIEIVNGSYCD